MSRNDKERYQVDQEVQRTLESLDQVNDIEVGPYFYARLNARIDDSEQIGTTWLAKFLFRGRLAPSLLAAVIVLNVLSAAMILHDANDGQAELRQEYVSALADEYLLTGASTILDIVPE